MTLDGVAIDPAATYRVVANSFLASGGDNFVAIGQGASKRDTGKVDLESMVDYMAEIKTASPDYAQRSIGLHLPTAGPLGYEAGTTFDVPLSSLDFSTTEPRVTTVNVSIGGDGSRYRTGVACAACASRRRKRNSDRLPSRSRKE